MVPSIPHMRSGARLVVIIFLSALALMAPAAHVVQAAEATAPATSDPQVAALAAARAKYVYLEGVFRWFTSTTDSSEAPRERQGDFAVVRGSAGKPTMYNVFTSDLDKGDVHRWCSDGVDRWQIEQAIEGEKPDVRRFKPGVPDLDRDRVVACVLLDLPVLSKDFTIVLKGDRLVFTPRDPVQSADLATMTVVLAHGVPTEVIIDDTHNTRIRLVITKLTQLEAMPNPLNELLFRPVPKNVQTP